MSGGIGSSDLVVTGGDCGAFYRSPALGISGAAPDLDDYPGTPEPVTVTIRPGEQEEILLFSDTGLEASVR